MTDQDKAAVKEALQKRDTRIFALEKGLKDLRTWMEEQFKAIHSALDRFQAPASTDESPELSEIRSRIMDLEDEAEQAAQHLDDLWIQEFSQQRPRPR